MLVSNLLITTLLGKFELKKVKFQLVLFIVLKFILQSIIFLFHALTGMGSRTTSTDQMLETENNRMVDDLAAKVSRLKGVRGHKPFSKNLCSVLRPQLCLFL